MSIDSGEMKIKWENIKISLWFIPMLMSVFVTFLAFLLLAFDRSFEATISSYMPWLFDGSPSAARSLLATIAGSVITVISIAFSLTIVAIQQASVQFTPRVLRSFTSDRGNQIVLGTYIATFLYSLLVLRAIRETGDNEIVSFVPSVATSVAILLVVFCIALLIYFINHTANSLQATTVIARVHGELIEQIDVLYPKDAETPPYDPQSEASDYEPAPTDAAVSTDKGGFLVRIEEEALQELDIGDATRLIILPKVGDFVVKGETVACLAGAQAGEELARKINGALIIGKQRSIAQDPLFLIRQLVDIALKALSPGINDPTTADYCIRYLADALSQLSTRRFPSPALNFSDGRAGLFVHRPDWAEYVEGSFRQIQLEAKDNIHATVVQLRMIRKIAPQLPTKERTEPFRNLLESYEQQIGWLTAPRPETSRLQAELQRTNQALGFSR